MCSMFLPEKRQFLQIGKQKPKSLKMQSYEWSPNLPLSANYGKAAEKSYSAPFLIGWVLPKFEQVFVNCVPSKNCRQYNTTEYNKNIYNTTEYNKIYIIQLKGICQRNFFWCLQLRLSDS